MTRKISKIELPAGVQPATDLGPKPEFKWLPLDALVIDGGYQRGISRLGQSVIRRIVEQFEWRRFQPLTVAPQEDGAFAVADGQHRAIAAMIHPLVDEVPCFIIDAPEIRDQARAFSAVNRNRTNVTMLQLYFAELAAGDPDALHIKDICDQAGIGIQRTPTPHGAKPLHTTAITTLRKLLHSHGDGPVLEALRAIAEAFPEERDQFRGQIVAALTYLVASYRTHEAYSYERLVERLQDIDLLDSLAAARDYKKHFGGSTESNLVTILIRAYNKGRSINRLPENGAAS